LLKIHRCQRSSGTLLPGTGRSAKPFLCFLSPALPREHYPEVILGTSPALHWDAGSGFAKPLFSFLKLTLLREYDPERMRGEPCGLTLNRSPKPLLGLLEPALLKEQHPKVVCSCGMIGLGGLSVPSLGLLRQTLLSEEDSKEIGHLLWLVMNPHAKRTLGDGLLAGPRRGDSDTPGIAIAQLR
jgi:hypothetical protein